MTKQEIKIRKEPKVYKLNIEKISKQLGDVAYIFSFIAVTEEHQDFEKIKPYLIIPESPKSIEELSQELEEKIDVLIAKTIAKFECSKETAEYYYNERFDRIISNFQYAKEQGYFPIIRIAKTGTVSGSYLVSTSSGDLNWITSSTTPSFVIKQGDKHDGYYTFGNRKYFRYYMSDKPNMIVRFFMKTCLGFWWVDEKDT